MSRLRHRTSDEKHGLEMVCVAVLSIGLSLVSPAARADQGLAVATGRSVSIEYSLALSDKTQLASNVGKDPLSYVQGEGQIVPGLEKALVGMRPGQEKHVEVPATEAYGSYDEKARMTIGRSQVPDDIAAGALLSSPDGQPVKVLEVSDDEVVLDLNHPLAGQDLVFDVKVLSVEEAAKKPSKDESQVD